MTYCIGWRYRNTVYLVGDTVFTNAPSNLPVSTFGELHSEVRGEQVAEAALKITDIATWCRRRICWRRGVGHRHRWLHPRQSLEF